MTEAHTIVAGEVGRTFRRRHHVVGRHRARDVRQAQLAQPGAETLENRKRLTHSALVARIEPCIEELLQHADPHARERRIEPGEVIRHGNIDAGRVTRIEAGH